MGCNASAAGKVYVSNNIAEKHQRSHTPNSSIRKSDLDSNFVDKSQTIKQPVTDSHVQHTLSLEDPYSTGKKSKEEYRIWQGRTGESFSSKFGRVINEALSGNTTEMSSHRHHKGNKHASANVKKVHVVHKQQLATPANSFAG